MSASGTRPERDRLLLDIQDESRMSTGVESAWILWGEAEDEFFILQMEHVTV
jgi:hypothetical protein